ncbi:MAG: ATP-binding protein, partial [Nitrospirales bacterium]
SLVTVVDPDLGRVKADPGQIEQVIMNLAVNARDAMPQGGCLTVELHNIDLDETYTRTHAGTQPGRYVLMAVSDTGCGMDAQTKARVFEPFFTTKEKGKGTGLGLSTVYGIIRQSGGFVNLYSELGQGTSFKMYLPRVDEALSPTETAASSPGQLDGTETVLLVEDEEDVRNLARTILERFHYTVLEATDVEEAIRFGEDASRTIHLLLTDIVMPHLSGRQLAERLTDRRPNLKVIFMSGYTGDAVVRHGVLKAGMAFLQKPFTPMALAQKAREVLNGTA